MKTLTKQQLRALYAEVCITLHRYDDYECQDIIRNTLKKLKEKTEEKDLAEAEIKTIKKETRDMLEELKEKGVETKEILRSHNLSNNDLADPDDLAK